MAAARVFTIPASAPFLKVLIEALIGGRLIDGFAPGRDPLALAAATLYLPTRRACRLARDTFLDALGVDAAILPRIVPIGDIDEDEIAFAQAARGAEALDLAPAIESLDRRLLLTQLVLKWATQITPDRTGEAPLVAATATAALELADDLARLIDDMTMRRVSWDRLDGLVPDHLDRYWQFTLDFLKIARVAWPAMLAERGTIEPALRRDLLIAAEATRAAGGPVIVAGSTGSIPATAMLIDAVARAPQGAVVLPGLDLHLDEHAWSLIGGGDGRDAAPACGHPQFALHGLLQRMGIGRAQVVELVAPCGRERLVSEALRPAAATDRWRSQLSDAADAIARGMDNLAVIEAANAEDEALAVAVALREAAQTPGKTAALVTPNRALARRVKAALQRWNLPVDDSGGDALADTRAGVFARLAAEAALGGLAPVPLLALLKHPLFRLGDGDGLTHAAVATLEHAVLRGPRPSPGSNGLANALASFRASRTELHRRDPRHGIDEPDLDAASALVDRLAAALEPLEALPDRSQTLAALAARHRDVVSALSLEPDCRIAAFAGVDGSALERALEELAAASTADQLAVRPSDYGELFAAAISDRVVRRPGASELRIRILGPLEARLTEADRVVLGGLVEGVWPPDTQCDAWLSRPMRQQLGLDLPERRIGLSAHDFAQMLGASEVVLSRADKIGGAPTVASRLLQRLAAVAGKDLWTQATRRGDIYLGHARSLDQPGIIRRIDAPAPKPPREARPRRLSVTEIEHWLRDPYTIYARHILRLAPLDPVDLPVGYRDRGNVLHEAIAAFTARFAGGLPKDPEAELIRIGETAFAPLADYPEARAFWWPRFLRIARWFASFEAERRPRVASISAEVGGRVSIGDFTLTTRADRIEKLADGRFAILDYKTGQVPSDQQVHIGLAPQLTLEAAILRKGGFDTIAAGGSVAELTYVALKGGEPAGLERTIKFKEGDADSHADAALDKLATLIARFDDPAQPYRSLALSMWSTRYGDYDHLARVKEWSATGGADGDGGGE